MIFCTAYGRVTTTPRRIASGAVCFEIACAGRVGQRTVTTWVDVAAFGERFARLGDVVKIGTKVIIAGAARMEEREKGGKRFFKLTASEITVVNRIEEAAGTASAADSGSDGVEE